MDIAKIKRSKFRFVVFWILLSLILFVALLVLENIDIKGTQLLDVWKKGGRDSKLSLRWFSTPDGSLCVEIYDFFNLVRASTYAFFIPAGIWTLIKFVWIAIPVVSLLLGLIKNMNVSYRLSDLKALGANAANRAREYGENVMHNSANSSEKKREVSDAEREADIREAQVRKLKSDIEYAKLKKEAESLGLEINTEEYTKKHAASETAVK
jgi:hypothetical protein